MSSLPWNHCPDSAGIGVQFGPEFALSWRKFLKLDELIAPTPELAEYFKVEADSMAALFEPYRKMNRAHAMEIISNPLGHRFSTNTLLRPLRDQTIEDFFASFLYSDFGAGDPEAFSVYLNTAEEIMKCFRHAVPRESRRIENFLAWSQHQEDLKLPAWRLHQESNYDPFSDVYGQRFFISVDPSTSDKVLIREYKKWLKQLRQETGIEPATRQVTKQHLKNWYNLKLLPYLDLTFWAKCHDVRISAEKMKVVLGFADQDEKYIHRTIRNQALKLLGDKNLTSLKALAINNIPEEQALSATSAPS